MSYPLCNNVALVIAVICLYSTGHWIGATALLVYGAFIYEN